MDDGEVTHVEIPEDQENAEVVGLIVQKLNKVSPSWPFNCSIHRVPTAVFKENPDAYIPRMISIGPLHHDKQHLQSMEAFKMRYFFEFLNRTSPKLENYVKAVRALIERAYGCYQEVKIERKNFVMMMVVDGGFILELLLEMIKNNDFTKKPDLKLIEFALLDLILVENQLPFFVLEELYRVLIGDSHEAADTCTIKDVISQSLIRYIEELLFGKVRIKSFILPHTEPKHLLDFVRQHLISSSSSRWELPETKCNTKYLLDCASSCLLQLCREKDNLEGEYKLVEPMRCAMELKNANVKFEKNKDPTSLLDIKFDNARGVLIIPPMILHDVTYMILRNLIAYEIYADDNYITEYIAFLESLIHSGKDVELLQESGIFEAIIGDPSDMAKLFNNLTKYAPAKTCFTDIVRSDVLKYYNRPWPKWKASLMNNYFNTPWALISVVAAIILLCMTFIQTLYAVLSYYFRR